jgi:hypothetical protein
MSFVQVISHIQNILNHCGDPIILNPTGVISSIENGNISIEINKVLIMRKNKCFEIPTPSTLCNENPDDKYWINRIRISQSLADDYSKNVPMTDDKMEKVIRTKTFLFACY